LPGDSVQVAGDGAKGLGDYRPGLVHLSGAQEPTFDTYTMKEGLPVNYIVASIEIRRTLWIGHELG
jgi:hypothetical protein